MSANQILQTIRNCFLAVAHWASSTRALREAMVARGVKTPFDKKGNIV